MQKCIVTHADKEMALILQADKDLKFLDKKGHHQIAWGMCNWDSSYSSN